VHTPYDSKKKYIIAKENPTTSPRTLLLPTAAHEESIDKGLKGRKVGGLPVGVQSQEFGIGVQPCSTRHTIRWLNREWVSKSGITELSTKQSGG